jgi:hypothetical protein
VEGNAHRGRQRGRVHAFAFDLYAPAVLEQHQIDLSALVRGPEVRLVRAQSFENCFDGIAFPRGADFGMKLEVPPVGDAQKRVPLLIVFLLFFREPRKAGLG